MYHQSYTPFEKKSEDGKLALMVHFTREQVEQHGRTFSVQIPWFTLEDVTNGHSLWCHRGNWRIDDPHEFFVSDDGWSVIHFHGRDRYARLTALSPEGQIVLTVGITGFDGDHADKPPVPEGKWVLWIDDHVSGSTAGVLWAFQSRSRFFRWAGHLYFVCRTGWGRYLVLDLEKARIVSEDESGQEALFSELRRHDERWALSVLQKTLEHREELESCQTEQADLPDHLEALTDDAVIALLIVRQREVRAAAALLNDLQSLPGPDGHGKFIQITPLENFSMFFSDHFREHVHLAMLRLGIKPKGYATRMFREVGGWSWSEASDLLVPECVENREALIRSLPSSITPKEVVFQIGAPEFIRDSWFDGETCPWTDVFYFECWDYDEPEPGGAAASWGLLWKRQKRPVSAEEKNKLLSDIFLECATSGKDEEPAEDTSNAELVSVTRFIWDEAYRMMREENISLNLARMRLA